MRAPRRRGRPPYGMRRAGAGPSGTSLPSGLITTERDGVAVLHSVAGPGADLLRRGS
ncbi:hypothetical protein ACGFZK_16475 [Streptomyces sp. NPDC048257]|uniref:hypothetical protein n=1 Tax=Streptomyces sp. NPDC048257 TaxID=3365526 RepID=UPI0037224F0D